MWAVLCRAVLLAALGLAGVSVAAIVVHYPWMALLGGGVLVWKSSGRVAGWTHGTARLSTMTELVRGGLLGRDGLIIGTVGSSPPPSRPEGVRMLCNPLIGPTLACQLFLAAFFRWRWMSERFVRVQGVTHLATIAPTGKGKGVGALIPNLLALPGSAVVFDPKGELFTATAKHRRDTLGHKIIRLDPFGVCGPGSDTYNPLDFVEAGDPALLEYCRDIGNQLVLRAGTEHEPHWNDTAENVIGNLLYFICLHAIEGERNLEALCDLVSSPELFQRAIRLMQTDTEDPILQRLGGTLGWLQDRELHSAMSTVMRHVRWMQSPVAAATLRASTFDPRELRQGRATLYLILPAQFMTVMQQLLRVWLGSTLRVLTRRGANETNPVLYMIDEAVQVGQMRALEDAVTLYRGMGIRCWFFWQSEDQMKVCFGERANVIAGNMDVTQYFGIADYATAEAISKRVGEQTITVASLNRTKSRSRPLGIGGRDGSQGTFSDSTSVTTNPIARSVFKPEEILTLPKR